MEDVLAKLSKVTHEKEEALQRLRDAESESDLLKSSDEVMNDLSVRLQVSMYIDLLELRYK